jgi:hypothetical protein
MMPDPVTAYIQANAAYAAAAREVAPIIEKIRKVSDAPLQLAAGFHVQRLRRRHATSHRLAKGIAPRLSGDV